MLKGKARDMERYRKLLSGISSDYMRGGITWHHYLEILEKTSKRLGQIPRL